MAAKGRRAGVLAAVLVAGIPWACKDSPSAPPGPATPAPSPTATPTVPSGPTLAGFTLSVAPDPVRVSAVSWHPGHLLWGFDTAATLRAPANTGGTLEAVGLTLRDAATGQVLGRAVEPWPGDPSLWYRQTPPGPLQPGGSMQPFLRIPQIGFAGRPARLEVVAVITDTSGTRGITATTVDCESLPAPRPLAPLGGTLRQNDPASGCPFDPVHGHGLVGEFSWQRLPAGYRDVRYGVCVQDGAGDDILCSDFYDWTPGDRVRLVRCAWHVADDRLAAHWSIQARIGLGVGEWNSPKVWIAIELESCRAAGVPACR